MSLIVLSNASPLYNNVLVFFSEGISVFAFNSIIVKHN
jgi:hypothetical protein